MTDLYDLATGLGILLAIGIMLARTLAAMAEKSNLHSPSEREWNERAPSATEF